MERKGGCCLAPRYGAAAAAQQAAAAWQMGRIMLKYRPIAPKPASMAPAPAHTPVAAPPPGTGRGKRKATCGGGGGGRRGRKPKKQAAATSAAVATAAPAPVAEAQDVGDCRKEAKTSPSRSSSSSGMTSVDSSPPPPPPPPQHHQVATLPLLPPVAAAAAEDKAAAGGTAAEEPAADRLFAPRAVRPAPAAAASLVTVEEVTATWRDGEAPCSAAAARVGPGADGEEEAPAFVSDRWGRVTWWNGAFLRAAASGAALGGQLPAWGTCAGFSCRVRVARRPGGSPVVAPCDVWRLDAGGGSYLWRLDLQAALTLGGRL